MIEAILAGEFGGLITLDAIGKSLAAIGNRPTPPTNVELQAERDKLEAMSDSELGRRHHACLQRRAAAKISAVAQRKAKDIAQANAREAAQFYNHADAQADFAHWSKAEYWTFNEAIAILLGKSPKVLTPEKVRQEILAVETGFLLGSRPPVPAFLRRYENLYDLARRAEVMNKARMHPAVAVAWACKTGAVVPPEQLVQLLEARAATEMKSQFFKASKSDEPASEKPQSPAPLTSTPPVPSAPMKRSTKGTRRDLLSPLIEAAQDKCRDGSDAAEVWNHLCEMARHRTPPLLGLTEDGIQYGKDDGVSYLSRDSLKKRLNRAAKHP